MQLVLNGGRLENKIKFVQFVSIWHLLKHEKLVINLEQFRNLVDFLQVANTLNKHWTNFSVRGMTRVMYRIILKQTKSVHNSKFLSINCVEVTSMDNQSWIYVHVYVVENYQPIVSIFLNLERLVEGVIFYNIIAMIIHSFVVLVVG